MYYFECLCGRKLTSATTETVCPVCSRQIVLEWGKDPVVVQEKRPQEPNEKRA
jgi:DNA-directed RNA polymerase subunit RPC12/RpoP